MIYVRFTEKKNLIYNLMKNNIFNFKNYSVIFTILFCSCLFFQNKEINANNRIKVPTLDYLKRLPKDDYILGPGDTLKIEVNRKLPELTKTYQIDGNGTIFLPRLKKVYVSGLTIGELTLLLNEGFQKYILSPEIQIEMIKYKAIKVYVDGEVSEPGVYVLPGLLDIEASSEINLKNKEELNQNASSNNQVLDGSSNINLETSSYFPSVFDAIRKSGGITNSANLSNIKLIRKDTLSNGGGKIETTLNFLELLNNKGLENNIRIFNGDVIIVPKAKVNNIGQLNAAIKSNLNPRFIKVFISGLVDTPGPLTINKTATLNDAIDASGGTGILKGPVKFIRFNLDGTTDTRQFKYSKKSKRGSFKNPYLRTGDLISIGKSKISYFNAVFSALTSPITNIYSTYGLYKAVSE